MTHIKMLMEARLPKTIPRMEAPDPKLITRSAALIKPEPISWIWTGRFARGKQTSIAGEPGLGKSQFGTFVTSTITTGGSWPDGAGQAPKGRVIILSAEDDAADTIVPRLMASGADLSLVEILHSVHQQDGGANRLFSLQTDLELLEQTIKKFGDVQAVLIDPVSAYFGKGVDSHKDVEVRGVLAPVTEMAARLDVGILTISHFNKSTSAGSNAKALHKFMGSIAFVAGPRVAFAITEDHEDSERRLFLHVKNNIAQPPCGLAFRLKQTALTEYNISASHIVWEAEPVSMTADEAVAAESDSVRAPSLEEAKQFLGGIIKPSGTDLEEIEREVKAARLSWATVRRAKDKLGIKSVRKGFAPEDGWVWKK